MKSILGKTTNYNEPFEKFMFESFNCSQFVTKITTNYGSKLDLIFANFQPTLTDVMDSYWSDHKVVFTVVPKPTIVPL